MRPLSDLYFDPQVDDLITEINEQGVTLVLVGGAVRDFLLTGFTSKDLDFQYSLPCEMEGEQWRDQIQKFSSLISKYGEVEPLPFGIFRLRLGDYEFEFSSPRVEEYDRFAKPYSHKDFSVKLLSSSDYRTLFQRRDFSINAIGIEFRAKERTLVDPYNGVAALFSQILSPLSDDFFCDPVRFLRLIRFRRRFLFQVDEKLLERLEEFDLTKLTPYHFFHEAFKSDFFAFVNDFYTLSHLYKIQLPEFLKDVEFLKCDRVLWKKVLDAKELIDYWSQLSRKNREQELDLIGNLTQVKKKRVAALKKESHRLQTHFSVSIQAIDQLDDSKKEKITKQVKAIFFESSSVKEFESESKKEEFFSKWAGAYLDHWPNRFYVALSEEGECLGYLSGCDSTDEYLKIQKNKVLSDVFKKEVEQFPAHLHINCHENSRGMGVGALLIDRYVSDLNKDCLKGLHIVTAPDARNVRFYRKLGFLFEKTDSLGNTSFLFMGKCVTKD